MHSQDASAPALTTRHYAMRKVEEARTDFYSGSLDELAALGTVPRDMFPGLPGRPLTMVSIRPAGVEKPKTNWWQEPGFVCINRTASGRYQMRVVVSEFERRKRKAAEEQRERDRVQARGKEAEARLKLRQSGPRASHLRLVVP